MRSVIALLLITSACFPDSARHRRYANAAEGAALIAGIALQYASKSNDCGERRPGTLVEDCDRSVAQLDTLGLLLIFAALTGFAGTQISANMKGEDIGRGDNDDDSATARSGNSGAWQAPQSFCPAIWAANIPMAEAALSTYLRSVGAISMATANDALHAWLSRQTCVEVEDQAEPSDTQLRIRVTVREVRYLIDISQSPFVVLIAN